MSYYWGKQCMNGFYYFRSRIDVIWRHNICWAVQSWFQEQVPDDGQNSQIYKYVFVYYVVKNEPFNWEKVHVLAGIKPPNVWLPNWHSDQPEGRHWPGQDLKDGQWPPLVKAIKELTACDVRTLNIRYQNYRKFWA